MSYMDLCMLCTKQSWDAQVRELTGDSGIPVSDPRTVCAVSGDRESTFTTAPRKHKQECDLINFHCGDTFHGKQLGKRKCQMSRSQVENKCHDFFFFKNQNASERHHVIEFT